MLSISTETRRRRDFEIGRFSERKPGSRHLSGSSQWKIRTLPLLVPSSSEVNLLLLPARKFVSLI